MNRYARQIALSEIGLQGQEKISNAHIVMIGAGGLGAAALPYLAAAGIGHITVIDHDVVDITNLHRQTIYRSDQVGLNKAECTRDYLTALNPDIIATAITDKFEGQSPSCDLLLDGSDNFETKASMNALSVQTQTPLISASVNQFAGQVGIFEGYDDDKPCYRCLFPNFPTDARNCNEAGILGTTAGIVGLLQAHLSILKTTEALDLKFNFMSLNLKTMRSENIKAQKDPACPYCKDATTKIKTSTKEKTMTEMISIENLNNEDTIIIDVRQPEELIADPLVNPLIQVTPLNIPLPELITRENELPSDKRLAFLCAGNIRSKQAADYLSAKGYENICVLDKFTV